MEGHSRVQPVHVSLRMAMLDITVKVQTNTTAASEKILVNISIVTVSKWASHD